MGDTARKTRASARSLERSPSPRPVGRRKSGVASPAPSKASKAAGKEKRGWHASVGGSPAVRGNTPLKRLAALFGVLLLMLITGPVAVANVFIVVHHKGSVADFGSKLLADPWAVLQALPRPSATGRAAQLVACFAAFEALLLVAMPGKTFYGPITAGGNRPVYKANGLQCFFATFAAYFAALHYGLFTATEVYVLFPEMIASLSVFAVFFCWFLYAKGRLAPSSSDSGVQGNLVMDYFWGTELYPRLLGGRLDVKTFTNCRFGMMSWAVLVVNWALVQQAQTGRVADSMAVCVTLMLVYVFKFFLWETGYWASMDIMHDRAGYMICWGCLTWVPSVYTAPALFLVNNPVQLGTPLAAAMLAVGALSVWVNYDSDAQRQKVRQADGAVRIWGKPASIIRASYVTATGEKKSSLLLCSGWWGVARHFHYVPELLAALLWTLPCGLAQPLPYLYVTFLFVLLCDRAARDDSRCRSKYTAAWDKYCARVPYRMLPYVY